MQSMHNSFVCKLNDLPSKSTAGRWDDMGAELLTLEDRQGSQLCLAPVCTLLFSSPSLSPISALWKSIFVHASFTDSWRNCHLYCVHTFSYQAKLFAHQDLSGDDDLMKVYTSSLLIFVSHMSIILQIGRKFRDEMRPKHGLLRCREFEMKGTVFRFMIKRYDVYHTFVVILLT